MLTIGQCVHIGCHGQQSIAVGYVKDANTIVAQGRRETPAVGTVGQMKNCGGQIGEALFEDAGSAVKQKNIVMRVFSCPASNRDGAAVRRYGYGISLADILIINRQPQDS